MKYPFVIDRRSKGKLAKVEAINYEQALNKVLALNPGKRVSTKFAIAVAGKRKEVVALPPIVTTIKPQSFNPYLNSNKMDLVTARVDAAKESRSKKKKIYINVDGEGECVLSSIAAKNKDQIMAAYVNGSEVPLTDESEIEQVEEKVEKPKTKIKMETKTTKKITAKKKSTPAKKSAAPAKKKAVEKASTEEKIPRGNNMFLTAPEWKKVDALIAKEGLTFSAWSRGLVQAKIK